MGKSLIGPHATNEVPESPYRQEESSWCVFVFIFLSFSNMVDIDHYNGGCSQFIELK